MSGLTHVSLFSGIGGIDLAMERAATPTVLACEQDKAARGVLHDRFPDTELHDDVRTLTGDHLRRLANPDRAVLSAGFPCQDLSVAGRRRGMVDGSGTRSALYWEVDRVLAEFRPAWVVLENVPGLLSSRDGRDMGAVLGSLADRGYGFAWRVLDAQHFGVPQRRRRVVIVGRAGDDGRAPAQVLLEPEGLPRNSAQGITPRPITPRGAGGGAGACGVLGPVTHTLTAEGHDASEDGTGRGTPIVVTPLAVRGRDGGAQIEAMDPDGPYPTLRAGDGSSSRSPLVMIEREPVAFPFQAAGDTYMPVGPLSPTLSRSQLHAVAYAADVTTSLDTAQGGPDDNAAQGGHLVAFHENQRGELSTSSIAGTLKTGGGKPAQGYPAVLADTIVRRLTPVECERLQGFPDGHTATSWGKPQADSPRYKQIGNAVAVPVFEWVARRIIAVDEALEVAA